MKKSNVGFERLSSKNYYTLSNTQKNMVLGGASTTTQGGSKQDGIVTRIEIDGKLYNCTPMRCWSSDTIDANGVTCYADETVTNVYTPYNP